LVTANVPNPTKETVPPFFNVVFTAPTVASSALEAAALEISACLAICSINSDLFTKNPLPLRRDVYQKLLFGIVSEFHSKYFACTQLIVVVFAKTRSLKKTQKNQRGGGF
jgi:hypothetical protein